MTRKGQDADFVAEKACALNFIAPTNSTSVYFFSSPFSFRYTRRDLLQKAPNVVKRIHIMDFSVLGREELAWT